MGNKVYYGEYSLRHWTDLILKRNIVLPPYQRYFVWDQSQTEELIKAFCEKQFIPPVTIGIFLDKGKTINLILDGQQRLTSILLAYLGLFPDQKYVSKKKRIEFVDENDNPVEDDQLDNLLDWNFKKLTEKGNTKDKIISKIIKGNYKEVDFKIDNMDDFLNNNYLGFSYLVPQTEDVKQQQKFYSKVFRSINIHGESLLPQESREALYYLDKELEGYFKPSFASKIFVNDAKIDFVRYLAILSQYKKDKGSSEIAKGYSRIMEKYYEEYIYATVGENKSNLFADFSSVFKNKDYKTQIMNLEEDIRSIELPLEYDSIIDLDVMMFGLIYYVAFEKKRIDLNKKEILKKDLQGKVEEFKKEPLHVKSPSAFKYLRRRVNDSIEIYKEHVI